MNQPTHLLRTAPTEISRSEISQNKIPRPWPGYFIAKGFRGPLGAAAALFLLLPIVKVTAPWGTSAILLIGSGALFHAAVIRSPERSFLVRFIWGGLALRTLCSLLVYWTSLFQLPFFNSLQLGSGFWMFAPDTLGHHRAAGWILEAWQAGIEPPDGLSWFYFWLAAVYGVFGIHPLHGILMNGVVGVFCGLLSYSMTQRLGTERAARLAALLVVFWPSTVWWSTQLLKEQLMVFVVLLELFWAVRLYQGLTAQSAQITGRSIGDLLGLIGAVVLTGLTRPLYAMTFSVSVALVFGVWALQSMARWQWIRACFIALAIAAIGYAPFLAREVNLRDLFTSPRPWVGHLKLGRGHLERGERVMAEAEFRRALEMKPHFKDARLEWVKMLVEEGRFGELRPASNVRVAFQSPEITPLLPPARGSSLGAEESPSASPPLEKIAEPISESAPMAFSAPAKPSPEFVSGSPPRHGGVAPASSSLDSTSSRTSTALGSPSERSESRGSGGLRARAHGRRPWSESRGRSPGEGSIVETEEGSSQLVVRRLAEEGRLEDLVPVMFASAAPPSPSSAVALLEEPGEVTAEKPAPPPWDPTLLDPRSSNNTLKRYWIQLRHFSDMVVSLREGQLQAKGHSPIYPDADLSSAGKIAFYLPKGMLVAFLAPFPWQAVQNTGLTRSLKTFSLVEVAFLYVLMWFAIPMGWRLVRKGSLPAWLLIVHLGLGVFGLALTMVNLGNIFRYRVPFFITFAILASLGNLPAWFAGWRSRFASIRLR